MNYLSRILSDLADGRWHCAEVWLDARMPTYSQRLSEENHDRARARRPLIESRPCQQDHDGRRHRSPLYEYRDSAVVQLRLRGVA